MHALGQSGTVQGGTRKEGRRSNCVPAPAACACQGHQPEWVAGHEISVPGSWGPSALTTEGGIVPKAQEDSVPGLLSARCYWLCDGNTTTYFFQTGNRGLESLDSPLLDHPHLCSYRSFLPSSILGS